MNVITVSKMRNNLSETISSISQDGVISIQKNDKDVAVLMGSRRYNDLQRMEDLLYKKAAELAFKEGFSSAEESQNLLDEIKNTWK